MYKRNLYNKYVGKETNNKNKHKTEENKMDSTMVATSANNTTSTLIILILLSIICIAALAGAGWYVKKLYNEYQAQKVPDEIYQANLKSLRETSKNLKEAAEKQKLLSIDGLTIEAMKSMQNLLDEISSTAFAMKKDFSDKNPFSSSNNKGYNPQNNNNAKPQNSGNGQQNQNQQAK